MNKNSLFTKALAGFLAVLMVFGTLVSLRGFSVSAKNAVDENTKAPAATDTKATATWSGNGNPRPKTSGGKTYLYIGTESISYAEYKQKYKSATQAELYTCGADFTTHISKLKSENGNYTSQIVLAGQDQLHEPGAMSDVTGNMIEYDIPQGKEYWLTDESIDLNPWENNPMYNYGPNRDWWLRTGTYFGANSDPWDVIKTIAYLSSTAQSDDYENNPIYKYFRDTIFPKMMTEYSFVQAQGNKPGCAIMVNGQLIGVEVETQYTNFGNWYKVTSWHTNGMNAKDKQLVKNYLLPLAFQCAVYDLTSGNYNNGNAVNSTGKTVSHTMEHNQTEPSGQKVARREHVRTMNDANGNGSTGSYIRMLVNYILDYAKKNRAPAGFDMGYTTPLNPKSIPSQGLYPTGGNQNEWYNYKGYFLAAKPAETKTITVTFHPEWYRDIDANGNLTNPTDTPHTVSGVQWPKDFKFTVNLTHNGSAVSGGAFNAPKMNGGSVANPVNTGKTWDAEWTNQEPGGNYNVTISGELNPEWVFLPGKTVVEPDANGNVHITGKFIRNVVDYSIEKKWRDNNTGSTAAPEGASATFQLKRNGANYLEPVTLSGSTWIHTWSKLPKYQANGSNNYNGIAWVNSTTPVTYSYSAVETAVSPADFAAAGDPMPEVKDGVTYYTFTNEKAKEEYDIKVVKTWSEAPASGTAVTVDLYANGAKAGRPTKTLNAGNGWTQTWVKLPKYDTSGKLINYSVKEVSGPDGYTVSYSPASATLDNGTLTLTVNNTKNKVKVTVIEEWYLDVDENGKLTNRTYKPYDYVPGANSNADVPVTVRLSSGGSQVGSDKTLPGDANSTNTPWTTTWENVDPADVDQFSVSYPNNNRPRSHGWLELLTYNEKTVDDQGNVTIRVKNLYNRVTLRVDKKWYTSSNDSYAVPAGATATFVVYRNGNPDNRMPKAVLNETNGWSFVWNESTVSDTSLLNKYKIDSNLNPNLDANGHPQLVNWDIVEESHSDPNNLFTEVTKNDLGNGRYEFINTNGRNNKTNVTVTKAWIDELDENFTAPNVTVKATLYKSEDGGETWVNTNLSVMSLNASNNWYGEWVDLPVYVGDTNAKVLYKVVESNVPAGYKSSVSGTDYAFTITNTKIANITVKINWWTELVENGGEGAQGDLAGRIYPQNQSGFNASEWPVTVELYNNGVKVGEKAFPISGTNTIWQSTFADVDPNGNYTVKVIGMNGAQSETWLNLPNELQKQQTANGWDFQIHNLKNVTERKAIKVWKDENAPGKVNTGLTYEPANYTAVASLYKKGVLVANSEKTLNAQSEVKWENLAKYELDANSDPVLIDYTVEEAAMEGFTTEVSVNGSLYTFTNVRAFETVNIEFQKRWIDKLSSVDTPYPEGIGSSYWNDTRPAIPDSITLELYANGAPYGSSVEKKKVGGREWANHIFENLPKYTADGKLINWDVIETCTDPRWTQDSDGYKREVDENGNVTVLRYNRQNFTRLFISKQWLCNGVATRPDSDLTSITFELYKYMNDGAHEFVREITLNAHDWQYELSSTNGDTELAFLDAEGKPLHYFVVEKGHEGTDWTPVESQLQGVENPEKYGKRIWCYFDPEYVIDVGTPTEKVDGALVISAVNTRSGNYQLDKTAKLTADGTYTATLTAQYNGPAPAENPATFIKDVLGDEFHVDTDTGANKHKNYVKIYTQEYLGKDTDGNDMWGEKVPVTVDFTTRAYRRNNVETGELAGPKDKRGLEVNVTGFDLEDNGCYVDAEGNAHGCRIVIEIEKLLANGDSMGDKLAIGDKPLLDPEEDRGTGVCGIYKTGENYPTNGDRVIDGEVYKNQKLIFPKPVLQIREIVQVYDFGLRQRNDDLLDFFGHGSEYSMGMGDVAHILALDHMYMDQTKGGTKVSYEYTYPYVGAHGRYHDDSFVVYAEGSGAHTVGTTANPGSVGIDNEEFEVGIVTLYTGSGEPGDGWTYSKEYGGYIWTDETSHPAHNVSHSCFGYFEPKEISIREFTLAALIEVHEDANPKNSTYVWCKVVFAPATNVYYEAEDFLEPNPNMVEKFVNGKKLKDFNATDTYDVHDRYQNHSTGDLQHVYGYDDAYNNGHKGSVGDQHEVAYNAYGLSNGQALTVKLTKDDYDAVSANQPEGVKWPSTEFSFTGEAFEVIASTNATSGFLNIQVSKTYDAANGVWKFGKNDVVKTVTVDTRYFGAADANVNYDNAEGSLVQIPVARITDLEHGTYGVRISAVYLKDLIPIQPIRDAAATITIPGIEGESELEFAFDNSAAALRGHEIDNPYPDMTVVLDAIRIFHPDQERKIDFHIESEKNGGYESIKEIVRKNAVLNPSSFGADYSGGIYIDYLHIQDINSQTGEDVGEPIIPDANQDGGYTLDNYLKFGPNNEMYLKNGNAFAFVLSNVRSRASLHIGAKVPTGLESGKVELTGTIYGIDPNTGKVGYSREIPPIEITSSTPMYYSITDSFVKDNNLTAPITVNGQTIDPVAYTQNLVIIKCNSDDPDAILSLTNIKLVNNAVKDEQTGEVSYPRPTILADTPDLSDNKGAYDQEPAIIMTAEAYESAMALVCGIKGDVDGDAKVTIMDSLKVMRHALGAAVLNNYGELCGDMDDNNRVDLVDAVEIIRTALRG